MRVLGVISTLLFTFCFIPQIIAILKTKNVSGISLWLWVFVVLGYLTGLLYVMSFNDTILIATYLIGLVLSTVTFVLVIYHRAK